MKDNGYDDSIKNLYGKIEKAASDGLLTQARKKRAHEEIRTLGNDVLHDNWHPIKRDDVELAQHYAQRIIEDFYDDRPLVLSLLQQAGNKKSYES